MQETYIPSKNAIIIDKQKIVEAIATQVTMGGAAKHLKVDWRTFKKEAEKYGLYNPCCSASTKKIDLKDILDGKFPSYPTSKILPRLVKEGYKEYRCEKCSIDKWNGERISLELNHIDGDNSNHVLSNLEALCPNCHSQTSTYKSKNVKMKKLK